MDVRRVREADICLSLPSLGIDFHQKRKLSPQKLPSEYVVFICTGLLNRSAYRLAVILFFFARDYPETNGEHLSFTHCTSDSIIPYPSLSVKRDNKIEDIQSLINAAKHAERRLIYANQCYGRQD